MACHRTDVMASVVEFKSFPYTANREDRTDVVRHHYITNLLSENREQVRQLGVEKIYRSRKTI